jgi:hypothetical protein
MFINTFEAIGSAYAPLVAIGIKHALNSPSRIGDSNLAFENPQ